MKDSENKEIINQPWPEYDLEYLECCPICGTEKRTVLYENLKDRVFYCAPGSWLIYRCEGCHCAYLDPRPTPESIAKAYNKYCTHDNDNQKETEEYSNKIKRILRNGYLNNKWGTSLSPASEALSIFLPKSIKKTIDRGLMRELPRPANGKRLLDAGCGNGKFLSIAKSAGWEIMGFDIDPKAIGVAQSRGLGVICGGFEILHQESNCFDAITASHVIEHVYDPRGFLDNCYRLLKPGGYFWIETPNIQSFGHFHFKDSWMDLDPPRHLAIQTWPLLRRMLFEANFRNITPAGWRPEYEDRYHGSKAIKCGRNPMKKRNSLSGKILSLIIELENRVDHTKREFITYHATK